MKWKSVVRDKFLYLRGGTFYVRRRVPTHLRKVVGKEHLIASLKTTDLKEAARLAIYVNRDHQKLLDDAEGRRLPAERVRKLDDLPTGEIEQMVHTWFANSVRAAALVFTGENIATRTFEEQSDVEQRKHELAQVHSLLSIPNHSSHDELLAAVIGHLARANGLAYRHKASGGITINSRIELIADRSGYKYRLFVDLVRRSHAELVRQEIAQLQSAPYTVEDDELREVVTPPSRKARRTVTLGELVEEFKSDPNRKQMRKKIELDYGLLFRVMDEVIGFDHRLKDLDRDHCRSVRDILMRIPANCTKLYPGSTFAYAAEQGDKDGKPRLSGTTVNSYLHKMSALFNYAVAEERMEKNPARRLGLDGFEHSEDDREPFSNDQLERIFSAPIFTGCQDDDRGWATVGDERPKGTKFWVPLIGLYQGMRLNEICQLAVDDFACDDGVCYFHVRPSLAGARVKTSAGHRRVPIHPSLLSLGLEDFCKARVRAGSGRLFPDLRRDTRGYYSDSFQKWFSRLLVKQGASRKRTSFHSFRHNWRDAMRNAGVPQERVRLIGGWKRTATDEQYGSDLPLPIVAKEIAKIEYRSVSALSSLI